MSYNSITKVSSIFTANNTIYDGLGNPITGAQNSKEAMKLAGLDWEVTKNPIYDCNGAEIPGYFGIMRNDTNKTLGIVTKRYKPVQNAEAFAFTDELLGNGVRYETAGSLLDGKRVWMLAKLEDHNDYKLAGDECIPYLLFSNSFDGKSSVHVALTVTRVWCQNTLNMALKNAKRTWSFTHKGDIQSKILEARQTLELTNRYLSDMEEQADMMTQIAIHPAFVEQMAKYMFPVNEAEATDLMRQRQENKRSELINIYNTKDDIAKFRNTAWGAYLALTDFASHSTPNRNTATAKENRFVTMFDGSSTDIATIGAEYLMANVA